MRCWSLILLTIVRAPAEVSGCSSLIGRPSRTLHTTSHFIELARRQSPRQNPPPRYQIDRLTAWFLHYLPRRRPLDSNPECVSAAVRCAQAGERWQEPRGTGQTNMDLRKTLISVLWILFVNLVEDSHSEEGRWKRAFYGSLVSKLVSAADSDYRRTDVRGGVWNLHLSCD